MAKHNRHLQHILLLAAALLLLHPLSVAGIQWLALSKISSVAAVESHPEQMCEAMKGSLIKKQITFCKKNPSFMDSVRVGAAKAIDECQWQFRSRRWNCSTLEDQIRADVDMLKAQLRGDGMLTGENMAGFGDKHRSAQFPGSSQNMGFPSGNLSPGSSMIPVPGAFGSRGGSMKVNPYDTMYNTMNTNSYGGNKRRAVQQQQQQQQQQQSYNRNDNRRGRRISRKARHGSNIEEGLFPTKKIGADISSNAVLPTSGIPPTELTRMSSPNTTLIQNAKNYDEDLDDLDDLDDVDDLDDEEYEEEGDRKRKKQQKRRRMKYDGDNNNNNSQGFSNKNEKNKKKNGINSSNNKWQKNLGGPYPVVAPGTRESAFVHAISSAGVAHALTRACSSGELDNCGCDRSLRGMSPEGFQWSGCSDNVDFGITFSRTFVDARDRRKSRKKPRKAQPLMNLHNNEAGRKLLERNMKVECKCHGVSGSCELKTCWRSVASFRNVGEILKEKFDSAHEVQQKKRRGRRMLLPRFQRFKPHTDTDLVYLRPSSDYCEFDVKKGSLGTHGRECDPRSPGIDGCELMCCNRGYTTRRERRVERCKCKFHWCCFVECEECYNEVEVSTCN